MRLRTLLAIIGLAAMPHAAPGQLASVYTPLGEATCRTIRIDEETGSSSQRCRGALGYGLIVHDDDARMSLDVVESSGRTHPLEFWSVVTSGFSSLGPRAEWRVGGRRIRALIVRLNASEDPSRPEVTTSYLVVARPVGGRWCVVARIPPAADANVRARQAADAPQARCLQPAGDQD